MARGIDGAIAELAPKTLGLLTCRQLDALGVSRQQRRTLVVAGVLIPVGGGVLRHAAHPSSWEQRMLTAVLVAGDGALASHMSAAWLWRFDGIRSGPIEVTIPRERRPRAVPGTVHRSTRIGPADIDVRSDIPRTSATRTFLDIAPRLDPHELEQVLDGAERDGKIWRPRLRWHIDRLRHEGRAGRPGLATVEALLDRTEGRPLGDTWLEQEAIRIVSAAGLRMPRVQVRRRKHGGGIARVDLWWDRETLVVELAGHRTHATRRQRQADDERAARLSLRGWEVVEFTYEDVVERPAYVAEMIAGHLAVRSGMVPQPTSMTPACVPPTTGSVRGGRGGGSRRSHRLGRCAGVRAVGVGRTCWDDVMPTNQFDTARVGPMPVRCGEGAVADLVGRNWLLSNRKRPRGTPPRPRTRAPTSDRAGGSGTVGELPQASAGVASTVRNRVRRPEREPVGPEWLLGNQNRPRGWGDIPERARRWRSRRERCRGWAGVVCRVRGGRRPGPRSG